MAFYGPKKWGTKKISSIGYRVLGNLFKNVNGLSIEVPNQKLCLPKVGLPFLDSSSVTLTSDMFYRTFYFVGGCQIEYSKIYS